MRRSPGLLLGVGIVLLSSCADGPSTGPDVVPTGGVPLNLATVGNSCNEPRGHPAGKIIETVTAPGPWAVAVRDDGLVHFTAIFNNSVGVTNVRTRTISGFIPTGFLPTGIAFSPDGSRSYTANQGDNTVTVIDVAAGQPVGSIGTGGSSPFSVQVAPDGTQIYIGNNDNTLMVADAQTLQVIKTVFVGFATNAFEVDRGGRMLYASSFVSGTVSEIDIFTNDVVRTFSLGGTTQGLALNRRGTHLYVANQDGYLSDVDLMTGQTGPNIPIGGVGFGVGVTPDDTEAWITLPLSGQVQVFNLQARRITGTLNVGGEPRRVAFSQLGKIGAITNQAGYLTFVR